MCSPHSWSVLVDAYHLVRVVIVNKPKIQKNNWNVSENYGHNSQYKLVLHYFWGFQKKNWLVFCCTNYGCNSSNDRAIIDTNLGYFSSISLVCNFLFIPIKIENTHKKIKSYEYVSYLSRNASLRFLSWSFGPPNQIGVSFYLLSSTVYPNDVECPLKISISLHFFLSFLFMFSMVC